MSNRVQGRRERPRRVRILIALAAVCMSWPIGSSSALASARGEQVVSLEQLLTYASTHAPAVRLARASRALGESARAGAAPLLHDNPSVSFAAGPRSAQGQPSALDLTASLAQPLELAGERGLRRSVARRYVRRIEAEIGNALTEVRRDVDIAYHVVVVAQQRVAVSTRLAAFAERALAVAERRLTAGDVSSIEVTLAAADAARARDALLRAEQASVAARLDLATVAGWPPRAPPLVAPGLAPVEPVPALDTLLQRAVAQHPQLAALRATEHEASARAKLADREAWPAPTLGVQFAREGSVGSPANVIVLGSVQLGLPLWSQNQEERGRNRAEAQIARERAALAARSLEARLLAAHAALTAAAERVTLLGSRTADALERGIELLERGLASGELSALLVSATRERLAQSELLALDAYADYYHARAELAHALGPEPGSVGLDPRRAPRAGAAP